MWKLKHGLAVFFAAALLWISAAAPALPQSAVQVRSGGLAPQATGVIAATSASSRVAFAVGLPGTTILVYNDGVTDAWVRLGSASVVATAGGNALDTKVPAGCGISMDMGAATNIAGITAAGSTNIRVTQGTGLPGSFCSAAAGGTSPLVSGDIIVVPNATFTRPANTTAYAAGQLMANNVTAGSVVPMTFANAARIANGNFYVRRARMSLSSKSVTNTTFRLHLFTATTGVANGDGGTFTPSLMALHFCSITITIVNAGSDVSKGEGSPDAGAECNQALTGGATSVFGLLEVRAAYAPASAEVIVAELEIHQN